MKTEYLLFNLVIILGPLALSFDRKVHFVTKWPKAFIASLITLIPFIMWDSLVTGRHWWFNKNFTLDFRLLGLPLEEWLFFITVPFATMFIWQILNDYMRNRSAPRRWLYTLLYLFTLPGIFFWLQGKEYTALVSIALVLVAIFDRVLETHILERRQLYPFLGILVGLILIFNGYLTARPVVLYDPAFQLDFRIITIPIEDFFYGISHVLLSVIIYEKLLGIDHE
ncbi:lycopene cyclase domain-containing protein [candidate division KSB1 bacterium]|nr:lycopene cyclase domain-containing protein [candidate division KSB1 bacterium]